MLTHFVRAPSLVVDMSYMVWQNERGPPGVVCFAFVSALQPSITSIRPLNNRDDEIAAVRRQLSDPR